MYLQKYIRSFYSVRNISSVEKNATTNAAHTVRYADKFNDVAYLTACGAWSGNRFSLMEQNSKHLYL